MPDKISRWLKKEVPAEMNRKQALLATLATVGVMFGFIAFVDWLTRR